MNNKLLFTLIRIQSRFRGLITRKKIKSIIIKKSHFEGENNLGNSKYRRTNEEKIVIQFF